MTFFGVRFFRTIHFFVYSVTIGPSVAFVADAAVVRFEIVEHIPYRICYVRIFIVNLIMNFIVNCVQIFHCGKPKTHDLAVERAESCVY